MGKRFITEINNLGYEAYIVGGCVRDIYMKNQIKDVDIATNAPFEKLSKWKMHDIGRSKDFGISCIIYEGIPFEVAQFRTDGKYSDGRRPNEVILGCSFYEDVARRDFTCNALGMDLHGNILDFIGGMNDIECKILRSVGNAQIRIEEDYIRMLRAVRFAAKYDFQIEDSLKKAIQNNAENLHKMAKERIADELIKMATADGNTFSKSVILMKELGLLKVILPEVDIMDKFEQNPEYHPEGNCFLHTISAIKLYEGFDYRINLALLLHDIGKPLTAGVKNDQPTYYGHEEEGTKLTESILKKYKFSNEDQEVILFCIDNHMRAIHVDEMRVSKIYKLVSNPHWESLKEVLFCDKMCREGKSSKERFNASMKIYEDTKEVWEDKIGKKATIVSGDHVMNLTGLKPGPMVGKILGGITDWAMENNITDENEINEKLIHLAYKEASDEQRQKISIGG